nr:hypothetical protein [Tanacetum cinerariifolium]
MRFSVLGFRGSGSVRCGSGTALTPNESKGFDWMCGVAGKLAGDEDDKGMGKAIMKEVIIISDDDTSLDALIFSNSDSAKDSHDYLSKDSSKDLINFLAGCDHQWQFPKETQEEEPKPLDVPMQT